MVYSWRTKARKWVSFSGKKNTCDWVNILQQNPFDGPNFNIKSCEGGNLAVSTSEIYTLYNEKTKTLFRFRI